ncbi:uncharacterized protein LOC111066745 [Drosophila obscura]|uniref:uncharacterized protein LOC111066745 n=1 Tax=Drosophila obscura TaxID=7282 RepID=UPI000BA11FDA|nr:uncharacterized protein LOC111066745 [Drosophila obscura]
MSNIQCKIMLNRCLELMRARIEEAQSRHVGHREQNAQSAVASSFLSMEQELREREKMSAYQRNKRRSMWEQQEQKNHLQQNDAGERSGDRTWVDFPDSERRRSANNRPSTAKPCNDAAKAFITQWGGKSDSCT